LHVFHVHTTNCTSEYEENLSIFEFLRTKA